MMNNQDEEPIDRTLLSVQNKGRIRNLIGFWILGLCNNYAYVIMLSAAFDLLHPDYHDEENQINKASSTSSNNTSICNPISTGAILLADILPSLFMKIVAPLTTVGTQVRVIFTVSLAAMCFIIASFSVATWMTFLGVICAALSSGLGEVTFLSYSSYFDKDVVSTWSSGTGAAGVIGALSYASLKYALSTKSTLQVMLIFPFLMAVTFWLIMDHPTHTKCPCNASLCHTELDPMLSDSIDLSKGSQMNQVQKYDFRKKILLIKPLLKYMIPLGLVYFAEYFINQGLMELLYFPNANNWLSHKQQYHWYQVDYQIGVLISRSSINLFKFKKLWILPILQFINAVFLLLQAYYSFLPNIWIVLSVVFYEGLLGGCAYVNAFYRISTEISREHKEYSMGVASLADSIGITLAGIVSFPVHHVLCKIL